jgi:predicted nucleic acid-binding protein
MGKKYLIDTNTIIDTQMAKIPLEGLQFLQNVIDDHFIISFVTYIEVLGYKDVQQDTIDFMALADVIEINSAIINTCIELRKQKKIKLPDAIIAATALVNGPTIISRNTKDFIDIEELECINPYEIFP